MCPLRWIVLTLLSFIISCKCQLLGSGLNITYSPHEIDELYEDSEEIVHFNLTNNGNCSLCFDQSFSMLHVHTKDENVARVSGDNLFSLPDSWLSGEEDTFSGSVNVTGEKLGLTNLVFRLQSDDILSKGSNFEYAEIPQQGEGSDVIDESYRVIVLRIRRVIDDVYRYGIIAFAVIIYLGFGCKIELPVIWAIVKKPVGPAIGILCQFIIMPLLGFGISKALRLDDAYGFGLLCLSTSPGGGGSNAWANLLGGDLDLSITMTFFSVILSLAMMPLWMFALGRFFLDERVRVPYGDIARTLATLVLPLLVGVLIKRFLPKKVSKVFELLAKPMSGVLILWTLTLGVYVNVYMYELMGTEPLIIAGAILVPWLGYVFGYAVSRVFRQRHIRSLTIAIETGYQNASIPIVMLQQNFPQPYGDLGAVMPNASQLFTQVPLIVGFIVRIIRKRCCKKDDEDDDDSNEKKEANGDAHQLENVVVPTNNSSRKIAVENPGCLDK